MWASKKDIKELSDAVHKLIDNEIKHVSGRIDQIYIMMVGVLTAILAALITAIMAWHPWS